MKLLGRIFLVIGLFCVIGILNTQRVVQGLSMPPDLDRLAVQQIQAGQYDAAIRSFSQIIQNRSASFAALSNRCFAYVQIEAYESAIRDCNAALVIAPSRPEAYLNRGLAHYQYGDSKQAIDDFTQALQHDPASPEAYLDRGIAYSKVGQVGAALNDLKQAAHLFAAHQQTEAFEYTLILIDQLQPSIAV